MTDPGGEILLFPSRVVRVTPTSGSGIFTTRIDSEVVFFTGSALITVVADEFTSHLIGVSLIGVFLPTKASIIRVSEKSPGLRSGPVIEQVLRLVRLSHDQFVPEILTFSKPSAAGITSDSVIFPDCVAIRVGKYRNSKWNGPPG